MNFSWKCSYFKPSTVLNLIAAYRILFFPFYLFTYLRRFVKLLSYKSLLKILSLNILALFLRVSITIGYLLVQLQDAANSYWSYFTFAIK